MKPLHLIAMVEDQTINKIMVDGGVAFNILPSLSYEGLVGMYRI